MIATDPTAGKGPVAVVVGLDCITGLQTARLLAGRGVPVVALVDDPRHFAARSRVCDAVRVTRSDGARLIEDLLDLSRDLSQRGVLIPCTDHAVASISANRERLADAFHVLLPDHDLVSMLMDKGKFLRFATANNLPVPRTVFLLNRADALRAAETLRFPCGLKPPSKTAKWRANTKAKAIRVDSPEELIRTYDRVSGWADELVAQEWVVGGDDQLYSCNAYFDVTSTPLVTFVARKLRQWPPYTGTSSFGEEVRNDKVLHETLRLFQSVGFHGLAYLEMKRDLRTGEHLIIEPNVGRPTGRSAIAEAGGVELVWTAYCDAVGQPLPTHRTQHYGGARWVDDRRDLQSAIAHMRARELTVLDWVRSLRGPRAHAVWSLTDPMPFIVDIGQSVRRVVTAAFTRMSGHRRLPERQPVQEGDSSARTSTT